MKKWSLGEFKWGWFVGDFEPTAYRTAAAEVAFVRHSKGQHWPAHIHMVATEINLLVSGRMMIQGETIEPGTVFLIEPGEIGDPQFLEDCEVVVVKVPSIPGDKQIV